MVSCAPRGCCQRGPAGALQCSARHCRRVRRGSRTHGAGRARELLAQTRTAGSEEESRQGDGRGRLAGLHGPGGRNSTYGRGGNAAEGRQAFATCPLLRRGPVALGAGAGGPLSSILARAPLLRRAGRRAPSGLRQLLAPRGAGGQPGRRALLGPEAVVVLQGKKTEQTRRDGDGGEPVAQATALGPRLPEQPRSPAPAVGEQLAQLYPGGVPLSSLRVPSSRPPFPHAWSSPRLPDPSPLAGLQSMLAPGDLRSRRPGPGCHESSRLVPRAMHYSCARTAVSVHSPARTAAPACCLSSPALLLLLERTGSPEQLQRPQTNGKQLTAGGHSSPSASPEGLDRHSFIVS